MNENDAIRQALIYDPNTGIFRFRVKKGNRIAGKVAGNVCNLSGYVQISVDGKNSRAHRLAVLLMTGAWPDRKVDHIDGNRANNAWSNLRLVTDWENAVNTGRKHRDLPRGVYPKRNRWRALLMHKGKNITVGTFDTVEEAQEAWRRVAKELRGEFVRLD